MNGIFNRISVRKYREGKIADEDMQLLLKAAMQAPSAGNEQPWEFVVIRDREVLNAITEFHKYAGMLREADAAIVVCGNRQRQVYEYDFWVQDCSAAAENILIQATELGIGSVWLGVYPDPPRLEGMTKLLSLPEDVIPLCVISLGYPDKDRQAADRYQEDRVHLNTWGGK